MSSIAIIEDSKKVFAVQVDCQAYTPFHVVGKAEMPPECVLAATGAYNDHGTPIGLLWDGDEVFKSKRTEKDSLRTYLVWNKYGPKLYKRPFVLFSDKLAMQIGPRLVRDFEPCWQGNPEKFQADAIRKAQHVAYGLTKAGKLLVCFFHNATLKMMADWFIEKGCVSAVKSDGGHAAFLEFDGRRLGNQGVVACAFCLKAKVKK